MKRIKLDYTCTFEKTIDIKGICCKLHLQEEKNEVIYLWIRETVNEHMFDICVLQHPKNLYNGELIEIIEEVFQMLTTQNEKQWEINGIIKKGGEVIK
jgi:hypothetical protein